MRPCRRSRRSRGATSCWQPKAPCYFWSGFRPHSSKSTAHPAVSARRSTRPLACARRTLRPRRRIRTRAANGSNGSGQRISRTRCRISNCSPTTGANSARPSRPPPSGPTVSSPCQILSTRFTKAPAPTSRAQSTASVRCWRPSATRRYWNWLNRSHTRCGCTERTG